MKQTQIEAELIEQVYEAALNPLAFVSFANTWLLYLNAALEPSTQLISHINQARDMLIQFGHSDRLVTGNGMDSHVPMFQVDGNGQPHSANVSATRLLEAADIGALLDEAKSIANSPEQQLKRLIVPMPDSDDVSVIVSNFARQRIEAGSALVAATRILWPASFSQLMKDRFGLGNAEVDIVRALAEGKSTRQISEERHRAFETVRTQVRTILKKLSVDNQLDLVRVVLGLLETANNRPVEGESDIGWGGVRQLTTLDGTIVRYLDLGGRQHPPILMALNRDFETALPQDLLKALVKDERRVLVPVALNGTGISGWPRCACTEIVRQLELRQVLGLGLGRGAGDVLMAEQTVPGSVTKLIAINLPALPGQSDAEDNAVSADWHHLLLDYTAIKAPLALEFVLRARRLYINRIGERQYLKALFTGSDSDLDLLAAGQDIRVAAFSPLEQSVSEYAAGVQTCFDAIKSIGETLTEVSMLHGADARGVSRTGTAIAGAGSLILNSHPLEMLDLIRANRQ